jgi:hypothetical protein
MTLSESFQQLQKMHSNSTGSRVDLIACHEAALQYAKAVQNKMFAHELIELSPEQQQARVFDRAWMRF